MSRYVSLDVDGPVAVVGLDRPPMNALSSALLAELAQTAAEVDARRDIGAVVVYGGPKVFAAGADVKELAEFDLRTMIEMSAGLQGAIGSVAGIGKPVIAAVTGYALGGGLELALACDFRVIGDNVMVGLPEITLGIIPGWGGTQRLPRLVGPAKAKDLIYSGRLVGAEEAEAMGLVDRVVAPDDVRESAVAWARTLAAGPGLALRAAKSAVDAGLEVDLRSGLEIERQQFAGLFATKDKETGIRSFLENGPGQATFEGC